MPKNKRLIVISAPSGGGKSVVSRYLLSKYPKSRFSISATTRQMRPGEVNGKDYFFLSHDEFKSRIDKGDLVEFEEIFGNFYGTLKSEIEKAMNDGSILLFDIDVKGAFSIKKAFPEDSLLIFLAPKSIEVLEERLRGRGTETEEQIKKRLARSEMEIKLAKDFDYIVVNDLLEDTFKKMDEIMEKHVQ